MANRSRSHIWIASPPSPPSPPSSWKTYFVAGKPCQHLEFKASLCCSHFLCLTDVLVAHKISEDFAHSLKCRTIKFRTPPSRVEHRTNTMWDKYGLPLCSIKGWIYTRWLTKSKRLSRRVFAYLDDKWPFLEERSGYSNIITKFQPHTTKMLKWQQKRHLRWM